MEFQINYIKYAFIYLSILWFIYFSIWQSFMYPDPLYMLKWQTSSLSHRFCLLCFRQWRICLQCRRPGFNHWIGNIPWRREWLPTPVFLPGEFHGQRSLAGYSPMGHRELDMTKWLNTHICFFQLFNKLYIYIYMSFYMKRHFILNTALCTCQFQTPNGLPQWVQW